ncbi:hypothetical protein [Hymenobacter lapidiphilus]|uniref:hypothetical protein n=1 Tax=Hymenobacter sp. CCM 8763 TaxID=2303334 RepID=UPI00190E9A50|nr:hypothetical protein [Hymenobacter sp. CCM 8763]
MAEPTPQDYSNRRWSVRLLLLNAALFCRVVYSGYLARYFYTDTQDILSFLGPLVTLPLLLTGIIWSLPRSLNRPFRVLLVLSLVLLVGGLWLAWFATHFMRGKW